jgi:hypothetical protein
MRSNDQRFQDSKSAKDHPTTNPYHSNLAGGADSADSSHPSPLSPASLYGVESQEEEPEPDAERRLMYVGTRRFEALILTGLQIYYQSGSLEHLRSDRHSLV